MIWKVEHEGPFRGESRVRVKNLRGETGVARVEYFPVCKVVGPVTEDTWDPETGDQVREPETLDRRPTFRFLR